MGRHSIHILGFFAVIMLSSCARKVEILDIIKTEEGHFRSVNIDDTPEKVMKIEDPATLADQARENTYLYYDIPFDVSSQLGENNSFTVAYNFEENRLYEIQADIYIHDEGDCEAVFEDFVNIYNSKYGEYVKDEGYFVWSTKSDIGDNISIELINESSEYKGGKLSLTIFNVDY